MKLNTISSKTCTKPLQKKKTQLKSKIRHFLSISKTLKRKLKILSKLSKIFKK